MFFSSFSVFTFDAGLLIRLHFHTQQTAEYMLSSSRTATMKRAVTRRKFVRLKPGSPTTTSHRSTTCLMRECVHSSTKNCLRPPLHPPQRSTIANARLQPPTSRPGSARHLQMAEEGNRNCIFLSSTPRRSRSCFDSPEKSTFLF